MSTFSFLMPKNRTPEQVVVAAKSSLQVLLNESNTPEEKAAASAQLEKHLNDVKVVLYGEISDHSDFDEERAKEMSRCFQQEGLIVLLISNLAIVSFETRKDIALIFNNMMRKNIHDFSSYIGENLQLVEMLAHGYLDPESALSCGSMLRECIRYEHLASFILSSGIVWLFFDSFVHVPSFEVASDAFNTLKELLTTPKHKHISSDFLESHYTIFIEKYQKLIQEGNYVTRRRSLKLFSELLLDRK
jgi:calcium binding protein 39